jgi:hypothetical protein
MGGEGWYKQNFNPGNCYTKFQFIGATIDQRLEIRTLEFHACDTFREIAESHGCRRDNLKGYITRAMQMQGPDGESAQREVRDKHDSNCNCAHSASGALRCPEEKLVSKVGIKHREKIEPVEVREEEEMYRAGGGERIKAYPP